MHVSFSDNFQEKGYSAPCVDTAALSTVGFYPESWNVQTLRQKKALGFKQHMPVDLDIATLKNLFEGKSFPVEPKSKKSLNFSLFLKEQKNMREGNLNDTGLDNNKE